MTSGVDRMKRWVGVASACALLAGSWMVAGPVGVAAAEDSPVVSLVNSFATCAANANSADVLLLIDQSSSLAGEQGSDPDNIRQKAALDFVNQLASFSAQTKIPVSVMASGFDGDYRGGSWVSLTPEGVPGALAAVDSTATQSGGQETDYWNALEGARKDLAAGSSPCDLVVWFTDGEYLVEGLAYGEAKPYSDKNARTDSAGVINDGKVSICSPLQGPMNSMRAAGVYVLGIGLSSQARGSAPDLTFLQQASEGKDACGAPTQPGHAAYIQVQDAGALVFALGSVTATTMNKAKEPFNAAGVASVLFGLDPYITSASVLADAGASVPGLQFGLQGPRVPDANIAWAPAAGGKLTAPGATVEAVAISDRAMRFNIVQDPQGKGFAGTWTVKFKAAQPADVPAKTFAQASISVVGDLAPEWSNPVQEAEAGADVPMTIRIVKADGTAVKAALPSALITASWVDPSGSETLLAQAPAAEFAKGRPVALKSADGTPLPPARGQISVKLNVTTVAEPPTALRPEVAPYAVTIKAPVNYPSVDSSPLALQPESGEFAEGTAPSVGQIKVTGPGCVWVDSTATATRVTSLPDGVDAISVNAPATGSDSCLRLEAGQSEALAVQVVPNSQGNGVVTGKFAVLAAPLDGNAEPVEVPVDFTAERAKAPAGSVKWPVLVLGMLLGLGIPAALLMWVRARSARIPVSGESADLVYTRKSVRIADGRVVAADSDGPLEVRKGDAIYTVGDDGTGEVQQLDIEELSLRAVPWGNPFAVADVKVTSSVGPVATDHSASLANDGSARLPLVLQGHWVALASGPDTVDVVGFFNQYETSSGELLRQISEVWDQSLNSHVAQLEALLVQRVDEASPALVGAGSTPAGEWADTSFDATAGSDEWTDTYYSDEAGPDYDSPTGDAAGFGVEMPPDQPKERGRGDHDRQPPQAREDDASDW